MLQRSLWILLVMVGLSPLVRGQSAQDLVHEAESSYRAGRYGASADAYQVAIEAGANTVRVYYNAACSSALADRVDEAFVRLGFALDAGYRDVWHLRGDEDLEPLRSDRRWREVEARCEDNDVVYAKTLREPALRAELLAMMRADQEIRERAHRVFAINRDGHGEETHCDGEEHAHDHDHGSGHDHGSDAAGHDGSQHSPGAHPVHGPEMWDVDAKHTARMKVIVATHGWPFVSMVGEDGATAAWLLVQHADRDPKFQRRCLDLMAKTPKGEVAPQNLAYLTDRVLVNEGKKQLYGTQFWMVDEQMVPRPIENEVELDARRKAVGLSPMSEYRAHMTGPHDH